MSNLPQLTTEKRGTSGIYRYTSRDTIQTFKGYNHRRRISDGEFYEMNGLCGDEYPIMRTLPARKIMSNDGVSPYYWNMNIECLYGVDGVTVPAYTHPDDEQLAVVSYGQKYVTIPSASYCANLIVDTHYCTNDITVGYSRGTTLPTYKLPSDHAVTVKYQSGWKVTSESQTARNASDYGLTFTGTATEGDMVSVRNAYDWFFHPVRLGNRIWMFPSTKYIDIDTWTAGDLANTVSYATGRSIIVRPCDAEGSEITVSTTQPSNPTDGQYWLDGSTLKQYSSTYASWISVESTYVSLEATGIGTGFADGDGIKISGFESSTLTFLNTDGAHVLIKKVVSSGKIVLTGILGAATTETVVTNVTFERDIPKMDYVVAHENRIWGCSSSNREVYACKLGDMTNWYAYPGIASDSYTATCIPDGNFTGAGEVGNYVVFFTESQIFRISGTRPANFTISEATTNGVKMGCAYSVATVNEALYYLGYDGIYRYSGSLPSKVTNALGSGYDNGKGAALVNKYILCAHNEKYEMFCYDTQYATLYKMRESSYCMAEEGIVTLEDSMAYFFDIDASGESSELAIEGNATGTVYTEQIRWSAETGEIGLALADQKYVSKIIIRAELADGADFWVAASYDGSSYKTVLSVDGEGDLKSYVATIIPQRCDHMKLKLSGTGEMHLYSISKQIEQGSEIV